MDTVEKNTAAEGEVQTNDATGTDVTEQSKPKDKTPESEVVQNNGTETSPSVKKEEAENLTSDLQKDADKIPKQEKLLVEAPEGEAEEFVVLDEAGNAAGDDAGNVSVEKEPKSEVKTDGDQMKKVESESKKVDSPTRPRTPKRQTAPDYEERIKEMKKINQLSSEALSDANITIEEQNAQIAKLEHRLKEKEQDIQRLKGREKSTEKAKGEIENMKKITDLKKARATEMEKNLRMMQENQEELMQENIQLRDSVENFKNKSSQLDADKLSYKRRIKDLEDKIDSLMRKNRQLTDANDEYKSYTEDLKTRNSLQEKKIERLSKQQSEGKRAGSEVFDAGEEVSTPKRAKIESPARTKRESPRARVERTETASKHSERKTESGRFSNYSYDRKDRASTNETKEENIAKIGLIGDINVKYIFPFLQNSKSIWTKITGMQTVDDLEQALQFKTKSVLRQIMEQDQVIIMLGTNNIRRFENGYAIGDRLHEVAKKITLTMGTPVKISEIPPTDIGNTDEVIAEVLTLNERIRAETRHALTLKRLEPFTLKEILRKDGKGMHLTDNAAAEIAKDLQEQSMLNSLAKSVKKTVLEVGSDKIGIVVGRKGVSRLSLQQNYQVRLFCHDDLVIIRGEAENRKSCATEINRKLRSVAASAKLRASASQDYETADDYQNYYYDRQYDSHDYYQY